MLFSVLILIQLGLGLQQAAAATAAAAAATADTDISKPNFLVLFVDDLGMNQVQCPTARYGYSGDNGTALTPNVARLCQEGVVFTNWYSSFHVCSPSRASMMTGRYSIRVGIGIPNTPYAPNAPGPPSGANDVLTAEAIGGLPLNETTAAEALKKVGYATCMLGKWHLGTRDEYLPSNRGFDHYLGIPFSQDMGNSFWSRGTAQPKGPYFPAPLPLLNGTTIIEAPVGLHTLAQRYATAAADFITTKTHANVPWYLYMSFNHVHGPNSCSPGFCGRSQHGPVGDAIEEMDWMVGVIMGALKAAGGDENTLVFYTSDNGAPLGGDRSGNLPLRDGKASTWEGGFREPGIARWPGHIQPGRVSDALVSTMDIFPTMMALAGVPPPTDRIIDGVDLAPVLFNSSTRAHECIIFYHDAVASDALNQLAAVRCGDYKMYWSTHSTGLDRHRLVPDGPHDPPLLFNVAVDVGENTIIAPSSSLYAQQRKLLTAARDAHLATITPVPDQNARGSDPNFAFCADPHSQDKFPQWPNCTISPENWAPAPICNNSVCRRLYDKMNLCDGPPAPPPPPPTPVPASALQGCFNARATEPDGICDLPVVIRGHCEKGKLSSSSSSSSSSSTTIFPTAAATTLDIDDGAAAAAADNGIVVYDIPWCNAACHNYKYFGIQYGGSGCFCGNSFGHYGKPPSPTACNMTCGGGDDGKLPCGGPNLNSVYLTVV